MVKKNDYGAFIDPDMDLPPTGHGLLDDLTFAVKDVFAVRGYKNSAGNPEWFAHAEKAEQHADVIDQLLGHGGRLTGRTVTDELMYSLKGDNIHFPPTINPRSPESFSGGSSSGSAVAAAARLVDFAMGTDTGGSVRIPSAYCGIYGMRPSHGLISMRHVIPLAPSFDTVGWMSDDKHVLTQVGETILPEQKINSYRNFFRLEDAFQLLSGKDDLKEYLNVMTKLNQKYKLQSIHLSKCWSFHDLTECFRILQGREAWESHGHWINKHHPKFGKDIANRFKMASEIQKDSEYYGMRQLKEKFTSAIRNLLGHDSLLIIPTTIGPAPERKSDFNTIESLRNETMKLTCIAGLSGLPQITVPISNSVKPLGLSFISGLNTDKQLLYFINHLDIS
ncbi:amidase [Sporolactobacillus sp. Y61]|uniref:Amidase n=1 Tax=Sporolactobacillus sp. Y61 TaxID=3160863 RepID=A0AAU8IIN8_9BACL